MARDKYEILVEENRLLVRENEKLRRAVTLPKATAENAEDFRLELNMNLLLNNIRDSILFFDIAGRLNYCSKSFLDAIGIDEFASIKGKRMSEILADLLPQENIAQIIGMAYDFAKGLEVRSLEMQLRLDLRKTGVVRDYLIEVTILLDESGGSEGFIMLFYDTTDFMNARREAEKANAVKSDFLATISHEIRTPMNAVIGLTSMFEETKLNRRQKDLVERIKMSSANMLDLINDLLDFSKIEAGKLEIVNDYFDLSELLSGVRSLFSQMMLQKDLKFTCNFADDLPQVLYSDSKRVRQIMVNLLNNAYKYTPSGSVIFNVEKMPNDVLSISVIDTGVGIHKEEQEKLFKAFEQLDQVRNKHIAGTGLGLAITKRICDLLDGTIEVQSVYGEGSTFRVTFPFKAGTEEDISRDEKMAPKFTAPEARVLIVDDVEINLEITRFLLDKFEIQSAIALDGKVATELVASEHFDLVLMDQMMPIMDGIEATRIIRRNEDPATHIPIVALTANAITGVDEMFKREGFDGFISKPIDSANLAWTLFELLPKELIIT
ncbi:MAG: response regulator [Clostridiales Family XIII bacterium]|jgi:signal transduction histidine kinase/CheY-like chemotaxis protein|nr:response regulator [Clostridiales Family XIII bacterium]